MSTFNPNEQILALDFDGVIGNSVQECLLVAYNAYHYPGKGIQLESVNDIDPHIVSEFTRLRNYIRSGADFMYILQSLQAGVDINTQSEYDTYVNEHEELHDRYFKEFYAVREHLSSNRFDLWLELNPFYTGMQAYLANYPVKDHLYIITTKKIEYVIKLLTHHHIELVQENLFTADKFKGKRQVLLDIVTKHGTTPEKVWYVDDQVDTLLKIYDSGVFCRLALWGYNNAEQSVTAKNAGIVTQTLDEFRVFFQYTT